MSLALRTVDVRVIEADGATNKRITRALAGGREAVGSLRSTERDAVEAYRARLVGLKTHLTARLLAGATTEFRGATLQQLIADTDRLIADATADLERLGQSAIQTAGALGPSAVEETLRAGQLLPRRLVGLSPQVVQAAYDNMADLLTPALQRYRTDVVTSLRRVALMGDDQMTEIARLRDAIDAKGGSYAQYQAERILRTELSRTFNAATYDAMVAQAAEFPFLRKGWKATNDSRTRASHRAAARTYARGSGIRIADPFILQPPKGPAVTLRFPSDPAAQPPGRPAAAETILCRCHAFTDFAPSEFSAFARQQVSLALGDVRGTPPRTTPPPTSEPDEPAAPAAPTAAPTTPLWTPAPPVIGPLGDKLGPKVALNVPDEIVARAQEALDAIDAVHGDGPLPRIALFYTDDADSFAWYNSRAYTRAPAPQSIVLSTASEWPRLSIVHEAGHWLDEMAFGDTAFRRPPGRIGPHIIYLDRYMRMFGSRRGNPDLAGWLSAVQNSEAYRRLFRAQWAQHDHVRYLATTHELFARSYAQYIATRSGSPVLRAELERVQALDLEDVPPRQWADADFEPIAKAFDDLFAAYKWRGPQPEIGATP